MQRLGCLFALALVGCSDDAAPSPPLEDAAIEVAPSDARAADDATDGESSLDSGFDVRTDAASDTATPDATPTCASSTFKLCEDFEGTAEGAIPTGWDKTGAVAVAATGAHRGTHALKIGAATSGPRRMHRSLSILGAMASDHWGRIFYKVKLPAPVYAGYLHSTMVAMQGKSPVDGIAIEARVVDTVQGPSGTHQFLYNVQPSGRAEFGKGSSYDWKYDADWHCAEWHVAQATQSYAFFLDGSEVKSIHIDAGAGKYANVEIPAAYDSLAVGWNNYQDVGTGGFEAWIDDLAIDATQVGCTK